MNGAQYNIWANGFRALKALGLVQDDSPPLGQPINTIQFYLNNETHIQLLREMKLPPELCGCNLTRQEFFPRLFRSLPTEKLSMNKELSKLVESEDKVELSFKDGSIFQADLVIGADGINSCVRQQIFPGHDPQSANLIGIGGCITLLPEDEEKHRAFANGSIFSLNFDKKVAFVCASAGKNKMTWIIAFSRDYESKNAPHGDLSQCTAQEWKEWLLKETQGFAEDSLVKTVMKRVDWHAGKAYLDQRADGLAASEREGGPVLWRISDLPPTQLSKGRVVLIGDAGHALIPVIGQGANCALEDSVVLVKCLEPLLGQSPSRQEIVDSLQLFVKVRKERLEYMHKWARQEMQAQYSYSSWADFIRNLCLKWLPEWVLLETEKKSGLYDASKAKDDFLSGVTPETCGLPIDMQKKTNQSSCSIL